MLIKCNFLHSAYSMFLEILCHQLEAEGRWTKDIIMDHHHCFIVSLCPAKLFKTGYIFLKQSYLGEINWNIQKCPLDLLMMSFQDSWFSYNQDCDNYVINIFYCCDRNAHQSCLNELMLEETGAHSRMLHILSQTVLLRSWCTHK